MKNEKLSEKKGEFKPFNIGATEVVVTFNELRDYQTTIELLTQERDYWEKEYRKLRENMMKVIYPPQTDLNRLIDNYKEEPET